MANFLANFGTALGAAQKATDDKYSRLLDAFKVRMSMEDRNRAIQQQQTMMDWDRQDRETRAADRLRRQMREDILRGREDEIYSQKQADYLEGKENKKRRTVTLPENYGIPFMAGQQFDNTQLLPYIMGGAGGSRRGGRGGSFNPATGTYTENTGSGMTRQDVIDTAIKLVQSGRVPYSELGNVIDAIGKELTPEGQEKERIEQLGGEAMEGGEASYNKLRTAAKAGDKEAQEQLRQVNIVLQKQRESEVPGVMSQTFDKLKENLGILGEPTNKIMKESGLERFIPFWNRGSEGSQQSINPASLLNILKETSDATTSDIGNMARDAYNTAAGTAQGIAQDYYGQGALSDMLKDVMSSYATGSYENLRPETKSYLSQIMSGDIGGVTNTMMDALQLTPDAGPSRPAAPQMETLMYLINQLKDISGVNRGLEEPSLPDMSVGRRLLEMVDELNRQAGTGSLAGSMNRGLRPGY